MSSGKITPDFSHINIPATQAQKDLMDELDVWYHSGILKSEAQLKIKAELERREEERDNEEPNERNYMECIRGKRNY